LVSVRPPRLNARTESDIGNAFTTLVQEHADALVVQSDPFFNGRRHQIVALAARHVVPMIAGFREFAAAGGLVSYGISNLDVFRQAGTLAGKILKGAKPTDLLVEQVVKIELVVNLKTAKALGLTFPLTLLGRADEVIE
jgi:putative ABC transport system substrate-binding protein